MANIPPFFETLARNKDFIYKPLENEIRSMGLNLIEHVGKRLGGKCKTYRRISPSA